MTRREQIAAAVREVVDIFRCPICHQSMQVVDLKSLICSDNHTFDFAKQGYLNMLNRPSNQPYDKILFDARQKIIMESNLYASLHKKVAEIIMEFLGEHRQPTFIFDAGSGEGSHLRRIINACEDKEVTGIGLDLAKEGIIVASRNHRKPNLIWLVGDLANIPLSDQSCHVILNILSPANYKEFKRVLTPEGILVKVIPRGDYFKELREVMYSGREQRAYSNDETISLFKQNFQFVHKYKVNEFKELKQAEMINLIQMSPLSWHAKNEQIDSWINRDFAGITIDLDILIGVTTSYSMNEERK